MRHSIAASATADPETPPIRVESTQETCPTLLLHSACDGVVFPFHALKYHDLLAACGREARLELIENTGHAFMLAEYVLEGGRSLSALECGVRAIDEWLAARGF